MILSIKFFLNLSFLWLLCLFVAIFLCVLRASVRETLSYKALTCFGILWQRNLWRRQTNNCSQNIVRLVVGLQAFWTINADLVLLVPLCGIAL